MKNKFITRIFVVFVFAFSLSGVSAGQDEVQQSFNAVANNVITESYREIYKHKRDYPELKDFDYGAVRQDEFGRRYLYYRYNEYSSIKKGELYHFGIFINGPGEENKINFSGVHYKYVFPVLGLKLTAGISELSKKKEQFDIEEVVNKARVNLWRSQQRIMPYQLSAVPTKSSYAVGEPIQVQVELQNMTGSKKKLKVLNLKSLAFEVNAKPYEQSVKFKDKLDSVRKIKSIILKPHEKHIKRVKFTGLSQPGEYNIVCTYLIAHKNIFPQSIVSIKIVDSDSH